jgi:GNAT superfamily N-acetyltransferase
VNEHVSILAVGDADHADWQRLWTAYQTFYQVALPAGVFAATWARLRDPAEPVHGALARNDAGAAIGLVHWIRHRTCWDSADSCYLQDLYVDETARGGGVGRQLIAHVAAAAAGFGASHVHWLTHESNARARRLYDQVATRSGFIQYRLAV